MKTSHVFMLLGTCIIIGGLAYAFFISNKKIAHAPEDTPCTLEAKVCPDGSSVGRVGPSCDFAECPQIKETTSTPHVPEDVLTHITAHADLIVLTDPRPSAFVSSPIQIQGKARGYWYFEGSFPITVVDWDGRIIGEGIATATKDWMTEDFVPFNATITYDLPTNTPYMRGSLILKKDNPSGIPENDDALEIPIQFK